MENYCLSRMAARYDELRNICSDMNEWFVNMRDADNQAYDIRKKSTLSIRVRSPSEYSLNILWMRTRFVKKKGEWKPRSRTINKGLGFQTPYEDLNRYAQKWEMERVWNTEKKLSEIRKELRIMRRLVADLRLLKKTHSKMKDILGVISERGEKE